MARPRWFDRWRLTQALMAQQAHKKQCLACQNPQKPGRMCVTRVALARDIRTLEKAVKAV